MHEMFFPLDVSVNNIRADKIKPRGHAMIKKVEQIQPTTLRLNVVD